MTQELDERLARNVQNTLLEDNTDERADMNERKLDDGHIDGSRRFDSLDSEAKVRMMATAADAVRAVDITILDLRGLTIIADFFLVCTGKSSIQLRAISDRIEELLRENGVRKLRVEGYQEATWILTDYGDVVAHVMAAEQRDFYDVEGFWDTAPRLDIAFLAEPTTLGSGL